jgi:hypothetical protein
MTGGYSRRTQLHRVRWLVSISTLSCGIKPYLNSVIIHNYVIRRTLNYLIRHYMYYVIKHNLNYMIKAFLVNVIRHMFRCEIYINKHHTRSYTVQSSPVSWT